MTEKEKIELAKRFVSEYYPPSKELTGGEINMLLDFIGWNEYGYNLAKQSEQVGREAMRWIKASEQLPPDTSARISWRFTNKSVGGLAFNERTGFAYDNKRTKDFKNIEWLYEPPANPNKDAGDAK